MGFRFCSELVKQQLNILMVRNLTEEVRGVSIINTIIVKIDIKSFQL